MTSYTLLTTESYFTKAKLQLNCSRIFIVCRPFALSYISRFSDFSCACDILGLFWSNIHLSSILCHNFVNFYFDMGTPGAYSIVTCFFLWNELGQPGLLLLVYVGI